MCGIFGCIGKKKSVQVVLDGLKKLEYRGYDSSGIAGIKEGKIFHWKEVGRVAALEELVKDCQLDLDPVIGQTRWATHGKPSKINAHPHFDRDHSVAVIHNGIIENYEQLKEMLKTKGVVFISETDSEVIAHLIHYFYEGDFLKAFQQSVSLLKGSCAITAIHRDFPGQIIAWAYQTPLVIGIGPEEAYLSSDSNAFSPEIQRVVYLENGEIAVIKANHLEIYNANKDVINKKLESLDYKTNEISKGDFEHFTLKEIHEQPQTIRNALLSRFIDEFGTAFFEELNIDLNELLTFERILILACGTSWHAGYAASYLIEDKARIPVQVEISSEYRYKNPIVTKDTLVIAISQSGETADTLAAIRELKAKGTKIIAICNVYGSTITREADSTLFLRAGPEIGVCSTKAFTSQLIVLSLFTLLMARMRNMGKAEGQEFLRALKRLPEQVQAILDQSSKIEDVAKQYAHCENFFFIGRNYLFPVSLEGALKLKEISYINANGYPAGELKHGPIALINENCPTIALCANKLTFDKLLSNLMEIKARQGPIIAIANEGAIGLEGVADQIIIIPDSPDEFAGVTTAVVTQLLAYYIARERGADIDHPRNLAKSVTVE